MTAAGGRLLDITRLASRAGQALTGVDRVELAYLRRFLSDPVPVHGLARTGLGLLLIDRPGLEAFERAVVTGAWDRPDPLSRLSRKLDAAQRAALSMLRGCAVGRARLRSAGRLARRSGAAEYFNVGHADLDPRLLAALGAAGLRRSVLIHDTIPLDHPDWQRDGTVTRFAGKLAAALEGADRLIVASEAVAEGLARHANGNPMPPATLAPLGVAAVSPSPEELPRTLPPEEPYFVALGTVEPRKNIGLLLDVWEKERPDARLLLCGSRGWRNEETFARLDAGVPGVSEHPGLSDGAVSALLRGSRGLLFPSLAEGYGLPPLEAAAMGVPVLCGDLAIYRETLGSHGVYLPVADRYAWSKAISELVAQPAPAPEFTPPSWERHFRLVLTGS